MNNTAKERVEIELEELKEKIIKLSAFLFGNEITKKDLSQSMLCLLNQQIDVMQRYARILQDRLKIWDKTDDELREVNPTYIR